MTRWNPLHQTFAFLTLVLTLTALTGCGPSTGNVAGKVTINGTPLKGGRVDFISKSGRASPTVEIEEDGSYKVANLSAGDYVITVHTEHLKQSATASNAAARQSGAMMSKMGMGGSPSMMKQTGPPKENKEAAKHTLPEGYKVTMPGDNLKNYVEIPKSYTDEATSGLTYKFTGGSQTHNIELVGKK